MDEHKLGLSKALADILVSAADKILDRRSNGRSAYPRVPPHIQKTAFPQDSLNRFWTSLKSKYPGRLSTVLPDNNYARIQAAHARDDGASGQQAFKSYDQAKADCQRDIERITQECRKLNRKYRDPYFDIEADLKSGSRQFLDGIIEEVSEHFRPHGVKRASDIFEKPQFYIDGATPGDVCQGEGGNCWLMAALSCLGSMESLIRKVCVAQEPKFGVYGFIFHRDGEWQQCIIDDKLYLMHPDYEEALADPFVSDRFPPKDPELEYRKRFQTGSRALYFAQCSDQNETWVPLLEKAYAKAHGDYSAISGGSTGEAVEDLTGGVTTEISTTDILDKDDFWVNELSRVGKDFIFSCGMSSFVDWLRLKQPNGKREFGSAGIFSQHSYSVLEVFEGHGKRLVKIRNPYGQIEWNGAWSDGSEEWNSDWLQRLNHKFGNDGVFWMSYDDMLIKFPYLDRTRIFGPEWHLAQQWTPVEIPWSARYGYLSTKFSITVPEESSVVIVLSQLDSRYFRGLEGEYHFHLQFRVQKDILGHYDDYIVRSQMAYDLRRSVSTEATLAPGTYHVVMKIKPVRVRDYDPEDVIRDNIGRRPGKIIQIGLSYDLAHAKGIQPWEQETPGRSGQQTTERGTEQRHERVRASQPLNRQNPPDEQNQAEGGHAIHADYYEGMGADSNEEVEEGYDEETGEDEAGASVAGSPRFSEKFPPWNANCVVGLRVYSKVPNVGIKVVLPEDERTIDTVLDRDDAVKGAASAWRQ